MTKLQPAVADKNCREAEGPVQSQVIDIGQVISHHITNYSFPTSTLELCNNTSDIFTSRHTKWLVIHNFSFKLQDIWVHQGCRSTFKKICPSILLTLGILQSKYFVWLGFAKLDLLVLYCTGSNPNISLSTVLISQNL